MATIGHEDFFQILLLFIFILIFYYFLLLIIETILNLFVFIK